MSLAAINGFRKLRQEIGDPLEKPRNKNCRKAKMPKKLPKASPNAQDFKDPNQINIEQTNKH